MDSGIQASRPTPLQMDKGHKKEDKKQTVTPLPGFFGEKIESYQQDEKEPNSGR